MMGAQWTPERDAILAAGVASGRPHSAIAKELGVSRNATIGRAHRLGIDCPDVRAARSRGTGRRRTFSHEEAARLRVAGVKPKVLARQFGVCVQTIYRVTSRPHRT